MPHLHTNSFTLSKTFASQDGISFNQYLNRNDGWAGPDISDSDLLKLGSEIEILKVCDQFFSFPSLTFLPAVDLLTSI